MPLFPSCAGLEIAPLLVALFIVPKRVFTTCRLAFSFSRIDHKMQEFPDAGFFGGYKAAHHSRAVLCHTYLVLTAW